MIREVADNLKMAQACFQIYWGKIQPIELNRRFYGPLMDCPEQSQTVLILLRTCDGLYMEWSHAQGFRCHVIMIGERRTECSGVWVTSSIPEWYADSLGRICEVFIMDWPLMGQGHYVDANPDSSPSLNQ